MKKETLGKDELIGLQVKIKESKDPKWIGKKGIIVDETKNTFLIEINGKEKKISKKIAKFEFRINKEKIILDGSKINYRPEDRINVKTPKETCEDKNCPFHGSLSVRGQILVGDVSSIKMKRTVQVKREYMRYSPKYERYEKRTSAYSVHCPPCIKAKVGDKVRIAECRPLSKTISFVVVEKI